jgi:signal transduction histidine kinase
MVERATASNGEPDMNCSKFFFVLAAAACLQIGAASAADKGNAEDAVKLMNKAEKHYKEAGKEKALADFTNDKTNFVDRDLYLFCFNKTDGHWTAHGNNPALIGRDLLQIKDANGKLFGGEMNQVVADKKEGWVDYMWMNPTSKKIDAKTSFVRGIGDQICGVGIYK